MCALAIDRRIAGNVKHLTQLRFAGQVGGDRVLVVSGPCGEVGIKAIMVMLSTRSVVGPLMGCSSERFTGVFEWILL